MSSSPAKGSVRGSRSRDVGALVRAGLLHVAALALLVVCARPILAACLRDPELLGMHDWDSEAAYRAITTVSLKEYHQFPFWHPYLCGGFPGWAYVGGAPNLVSPFAPFYFLASFPMALRLELVGSVVVALAGTYLLTLRFTKSTAVAVLVAVVAVLNGRFALQTAAGHMWHFHYAWQPWALYFFDRAARGKDGRAGSPLGFAWAGAFLALMVYTGALYPLPHTALLLGLYGLGLALRDRSPRPVVGVAVAGLVAFGLAAPKLLPALDLMRRFPRTIDSTEAIDPGQLWAMLTGWPQSFHHATTSVPAYGWHEWGIYVGLAPVAILLLGTTFARGPLGRTWQLVVLAFAVLGLGAFHAYAPWTLLHTLPIFKSQHVPSRFHFTMLLAAGIATACTFEQRFRGLPWRRFFVEVATMGIVAWSVQSLVETSASIVGPAFHMHAPDVPRRPEFRQIHWPTYNYSPADAWAGPSWPMIVANEGFEGCFSVPDKADPKGAIPVDDRGYRGEAYVEGGAGQAKIVRWSPNEVEIAVDGAAAGTTLVWNMNFDPGWSANGERAVDVHHAVGRHLPPGASTTLFRYRPRAWPLGLGVGLVTVAAIVAAIVLRTRRRILPGRSASHVGTSPGTPHSSAADGS